MDIQNFYDRIGRMYDWAERFEGKAKAAALEDFAVSRGDRILNVGAGTGIDHQKLARQVGSTGMVVAVDLSPVMLRLVKERTGQPAVRADARSLPFGDGLFRGVFCSFMLDLIPSEDLLRTVEEFHRVLRVDGQVALLTLTEGTTPLSRSLVALWNRVYSISPVACGGCRPVELMPLMIKAGFHDVSRKVIVEAGFPSQIIKARS